MILSALRYADKHGRLPAKLLFENDGTTVAEGQISPELLYKDIVDAPAYPRHISLARELGAGSWAITGAEKFALRNAPQEIIISMDFPARSTHYFSIKGIKKFNALYLVGIPWNGDPGFQQYHSGWHYDETNETLYVKIRHRAKTEKIRILYYEPELADQPAGETANDDL